MLGHHLEQVSGSGSVSCYHALWLRHRSLDLRQISHALQCHLMVPSLLLQIVKITPTDEVRLILVCRWSRWVPTVSLWTRTPTDDVGYRTTKTWQILGACERATSRNNQIRILRMPIHQGVLSFRDAVPTILSQRPAISLAIAHQNDVTEMTFAPFKRGRNL
jgi:hypothetical protein